MSRLSGFTSGHNKLTLISGVRYYRNFTVCKPDVVQQFKRCYGKYNLNTHVRSTGLHRKCRIICFFWRPKVLFWICPRLLYFIKNESKVDFSWGMPGSLLQLFLSRKEKILLVLLTYFYSLILFPFNFLFVCLFYFLPMRGTMKPSFVLL